MPVSAQQQLHTPSLHTPSPRSAALQDGQDIKPSERIAAKQALPHLQMQLAAELQAEGIDPEAAGQVCLPGDTDGALHRLAKLCSWPPSMRPWPAQQCQPPSQAGGTSACALHSSGMLPVGAHMLPWPAVHITTSSIPTGGEGQPSLRSIPALCCRDPCTVLVHPAQHCRHVLAGGGRQPAGGPGGAGDGACG